MKPLLAALLILIAPPLLCQTNMSLRDDLNQYLSQYPPKYKTAGTQIIGIKEGRIDFYKYSPQTTDADLKILVILDRFPIGILQSVNGRSQILLDLDGDGKLDANMGALFVPFWVVSANTPSSLRTGNNNMSKYLDGLYSSFQSDANPYQTNGELGRSLSQMTKDLQNDNIENRDLLYSLFCYYSLSSAYPLQALACLGYLAENYITRFGKDHPLLYLHTLETLINLSETDKAKSMLNSLLQMDPDFVPAQVYRWQLETDGSKRDQYYKALKTDHPEHWIVKQI